MRREMAVQYLDNALLAAFVLRQLHVVMQFLIRRKLFEKTLL